MKRGDSPAWPNESKRERKRRGGEVDWEERDARNEEGEQRLGKDVGGKQKWEEGGGGGRNGREEC